MRILNVGGVNVKAADAVQTSFVEQPREIRIALLCERDDDPAVAELFEYYLAGRRIRLQVERVEEEEGVEA